MRSFTLVIATVLLATPVAAENPIADHAELWENVRERAGKPSNDQAKAEKAADRQASQNTEGEAKTDKPASK